RHDVLNQLQVIHGYLSLHHYNKAESNMTELLDHFQQERKLLQLMIPNVFLWFLQFRTRYNHFELDYDIDIEHKTLKNNDLYIMEKFELIMHDVQRKCCGDHYYHVEIEFKDNIDFADITVYIDMGRQEAEGESHIILENIDFEVNENESMYRFRVSIENEVN